MKHPNNDRLASARAWPLAAATLAALLLAGGAGCTQTLAWTVAQFAPPKKVKAVYEAPKGKTYLVFVEYLPAQTPWDQIKAELASRISRKLQEQPAGTTKFAANVISYERLQDLAATTKDFQTMPRSEVGRKLGADIVLYVQIEDFSLRDSPFMTLWQGRLGASVWLVDVQQTRRIWPAEAPPDSGYQAPPVVLKPTNNPSPTYGEEIAHELAEQMADHIVKLFYDHEEPRDTHNDEQ
jgi:hypothetical protein